MKALYKYPMTEFPYKDLVDENKRRTREEREYEIEDTGIFEKGYWDVMVEYAKEDDNDIVIRISLTNMSTSRAPLHVLPTLWFRNTWIWGCLHEGCTMKPSIEIAEQGESFSSVRTKHDVLEPFQFIAGAMEGEAAPKLLFTENETNTELLFGAEQYTPYTKDAFHRYVVSGDAAAVSPRPRGTKCAAHYAMEVDAGKTATIRLRLSS
jgi:hypothetical protein